MDNSVTLCWLYAGSTTASCSSPPAGSIAYAYDADGNRLVSTYSPSLTYNDKNQMASLTPTGYPTEGLTYAGAGQAERVTKGPYAYANGVLGLGSQTASGSSTYFTRDPDGNLVSMRTGGRSYYYVTDVQGSVIELTDPSANVAAAYTYEAYGVITASSGPMAGANPFTFAGGYYDYEVALDHFAQRYEDPYTGSFTQLDPTGQGYVYAGDDPVNLGGSERHQRRV